MRLWVCCCVVRCLHFAPARRTPLGEESSSSRQVPTVRSLASVFLPGKGQGWLAKLADRAKSLSGNTHAQAPMLNPSHMPARTRRHGHKPQAGRTTANFPYRRDCAVAGEGKPRETPKPDKPGRY